MKVLMIGVDKTSVGGMLTVVQNYLNSDDFCKATDLHYISTVIRANKLKKITTFFKKIPIIKRTIKKDGIDIVHVHMAEKGSVFREGYVVHLAKKMGCKTVIHMHGANIEKWYNSQNPLVKNVVKKIFNSADCMIVLGEKWKPFMVSVMGEENAHKIRVLHNAVNVPKRKLYNIKSTNVLFYGMLIQRKGIDDLLGAFKKILPVISPDIRLMLYGDDYDSPEKIQDKIARYGLTHRAYYKGWLTDENKSKVLEDTRVNVLPSYNEGLPMTILESMSYGVPNISTNVAAIPEAIDDGINGFIIEPGDIEELSKKLVQLIQNKKLRSEMSTAAYTKAQREFSLEVHFSKLISIYESLLK
ncbi:glycosyl transferase [Lactobacillus delbrueckii]|uniref:glycosyltransferase family 4 protein n=1 Tax=Lactobacillus delbrueckii TaxID=1584 RepID=UPI001F37DBD4|nr:glycosyltransferase family 4 protein [Lactobacillus delbrueckii]GHN23882.1 glycosyl transferase [Lactobacillus delbrueckii]GHN27097.1 glycosyl transferase [Lactobacillus delbrueckii]GHN28186.1 glycosyl transferase [Lactobacillus delbrueckii]